MSEASTTYNIVSKEVIDRLFSILEQVDRSERDEIIKDWIVRYGSNNPIFYHTDEDEVTTFLLVENDTTEHWKKLYLVGDSFGWDTPRVEFKSIKDTRWWYVTFKRPRGARIHYKLSPNDLGTRITDETRADRYQNFILDSRNPETANEGMQTHSVIEYPDFKQTIELGSKNHEFTNIYMRKKLDGNRTARFCVIGNAPRKLLVVHDGSAFSKVMQGHQIIAKGVKEGRWPSMAILSLNSPYGERTREYGGRYGYPKYFRDVIIPTIEHHIGKTFGPEDIILHGSSLGAWGLLDVVCQVDVARNLILHSCPFWWPDDDHQKYIREIEENEIFNIDRLYFDVGVFETGREPMSTYESNKRFAQALKESDQEFMAREFLMGHRYSAWAWAFPGALDYIFNGVKKYGPLPGRKLDIE